MASNNFNQDPDGIPMKKMGPGAIVIGAVAVVIIGGLVAFGAMGHKKKAGVSEAQIESAEASAEHAKEQAKARSENAKILYKAVSRLNQEHAAASASAAAAQQAQQAQAQQAAPEQHHAAAPAHHAVSRAAAKKQINTLDNLSKSITSQLGN